MNSQFFYFLCVGGVNTLVGYGLFAGFSYAGICYPLALLLANFLGVLFNFKTTGRLVFKNNTSQALGSFIMLYALLYALNLLLMRLVLMWIANVYAAGFLVALPLALLGFILNKHVVFKESNETH